VGVGAFQVHRGHPFEGFLIAGPPGGDVVVEARCGCGVVLCVADAVFAACPECSGKGAAACRRCEATGLILDHAALEWRLPSETEGK
jgi:hypothetical protein